MLPPAWRAAASVAMLGLGSLTVGCASQAREAPELVTVAPEPGMRPAGEVQTGRASYYAHYFAGRRMANGRRFDPRRPTVAHRTLPFGTVVQVTNLDNGLSETAVVEDRGPFIRGRIVDLSRVLAERLDMIRQGTARVEVQPVEVAEAPE